MTPKKISVTLILLLVYYFAALFSTIITNTSFPSTSSLSVIAVLLALFGLTQVVLSVIIFVRMLHTRLLPIKIIGWAIMLQTILPIISSVLVNVFLSSSFNNYLTTLTVNSYSILGIYVVTSFLWALGLMKLRKVGSITPKFNLPIFLLLSGALVPMVSSLLNMAVTNFPGTWLYALSIIGSLCFVLGWYFLFRNPEEFISASAER